MRIRRDQIWLPCQWSAASSSSALAVRPAVMGNDSGGGGGSRSKCAAAAAALCAFGWPAASKQASEQNALV